jgi:NAD-dependent dihydropyrimidine dehydrogenase PreA subunit
VAETNFIEITINEEMCTGCRICQLVCSSIYQKKFSPNDAYIQIFDPYELIPKISFLEGCNKCGQCARHCLYGALIIKESED